MDTSTTAIDAQSLRLLEPAEKPTHRLRRVLESTCDGLYRFILLRVSSNRDAADDLLQQTCQEAVRHRRIPEDDEQCEAWLRGIAKNLIRRHWRIQKRSRRIVSVDEAAAARQLAAEIDSRPLPSEQLARREVIQALMLAVTSLTHAEQQLVSAFYFDGRSQIEIAQQAGATIKSVQYTVDIWSYRGFRPPERPDRILQRMRKKSVNSMSSRGVR